MSHPRANELLYSNAAITSESKEVASNAPEEQPISTDADSLHQDVMPIIFDYLDNKIGETPQPYIKNYTFFGNLTRLYTAQATLAALPLLQGDTVTTEALVEKNPDILNCIVEAMDHRGNKVKGTLLQIAALLGDCNIRELQIPENDHGMVERLQAYLPPELALKQLQATRPAGWEQETAGRMQPYFDAATKFMNDIINTRHVPHSTYATIEACSAHIPKFRNTLATIPSQQPVITTGLIFDPQIFVKVIDDLLAKNINRLGGWWSDKSNLFAIVGFGSLQTCASACDLQMMAKGLYYVMNEGQRPDRSLNFVAGVPQVAGLGIDCFLDIFGGDRWRAAGVTGSNVGRYFQNYVQAKKVSLQRVMQQPDNHAKNRCVIL